MKCCLSGNYLVLNQTDALEFSCDHAVQPGDCQVIDLTTGQRLGYVCDAEIDLEQGKIVSLIVPGQKKLGGLLSGDDDYILPWESISRLGEDIILAEVAAQQPRRRREKRQNYL